MPPGGLSCSPQPDAGLVPDALQRPDGSSKFRARNSELYATQELLDAEARLLDAAAATDAPTAPMPAEPDPAEAVAAGRKVLSAEQAAAVSAVVTSGRRLDLIVGAAGTGKSTTMAGVRAAWEAAHGPGSVIGLAPSAAAAEVLADAVGVPTENTAKWITEHRSPPRTAPRDRVVCRSAGSRLPLPSHPRTAEASGSQLERHTPGSACGRGSW